MDKDEKNLEILVQMMDKLDTKSTMDEIVKAFELIIEIVKEEKDLTATELKKLQDSYDEVTTDIRNGSNLRFSELKREFLTTFKSKTDSFDEKFKKLLNRLEDKISTIENGKDADEEIIVGKVLAKIPPFEPVKELTPFEVRDKLESIDVEEEKLPISAIKDLRKELDELKKQKTNFTGVGLSGIGARDLVKDIDLSDQLDGIKTTFNIQAIWNVISINLSSYPYGSLRKGIDYTFTPTSITFTSNIDPVTQLSAGQQCILTVIQG